MKKRILFFTAFFCLVLNARSQAVLESARLPQTSNGFMIKKTVGDTTYGFFDKYMKLPDGRELTIKSLGITLESVTKTIYVSQYLGNDSNDGSSWANSFATFDSAIYSIGNLLDAPVTIQMDSGTYYCSIESSRLVTEIESNSAVDLNIVGFTDTITTLTGKAQSSENMFRYDVTNTLTADELKKCFIEGSFRVPIYSNGVDYIVAASTVSTNFGTIVTKNKTNFIFNDPDHIVINYFSNYSNGGIFFKNLVVKPLGNKALRFAAFAVSKLKFDGCVLEALNIKNNNVSIDQCYIDNTQRGIICDNYNSFIIQSVVEGPGKTSGKNGFELQNSSIVLDNVIIDGFTNVFQNIQGVGNVSFYDNSGDIYVLNCGKIFVANDGFYFGSGNLDKLYTSNVDYYYKTVSDKNVNIILDTSLISGIPIISYVENDNGIRVKPEKNYVAYIRGVHDTNDFIVPTLSNLADTIRTGYIKNIGDNDLIIGRKYPVGGLEIGTGLDADFDIKLYYDNNYNESFGFGLSGIGTSSVVNLHTNNGVFDIYRTSMKWFDNAAIQYASLDTNGFEIDTITTNEIKSDTSISVNANIYSKLIVVPFASSITLDGNTSNTFEITLTNDLTNLDLINLAPGTSFYIKLVQSVGGGNAITLSSTFNKQMISHVAFDETGGITNLLWIWTDGTNVYYSNMPSIN